MKKILFLGINARYSHTNPALYYMKHYAVQYKYNTEILEFSLNHDPQDVLTRIKSANPDILALSVYIWNTEYISFIINNLKELSPSPILVLGGPEVSYDPDEWLSNYATIDYIVTGPGESAFIHLLENNFTVPEAIINKQNMAFNSIPLPYSAGDIENFKNRYIYYESSRGCPFKCSYCLSSRDDQKLELKDIDTVKDEIDFIMHYKPKIIKFVDRTFNLKKSHYLEIWKHLIKEHGKSGTVFHFEIYPSLVDSDDLEILSHCPENFFQFEIGVQTVNPMSLSAINRHDQWEQIKPGIGKLIELGNIHIHVDLIAGLPHDTMKSIKRGIDEILELEPHYFQLGFLKIMKGTAMMENVEKFGISYENIPPYKILQNNWLSSADINELDHISSIIDRTYNTKKFKITLSSLKENFESYFDLFKDISHFIQRHRLDMADKTWENNAVILIDFISSWFPEKKEYYMDCLRWDWCTTAQSHRYPRLIKPVNAGELKKKVFKIFNNKEPDDKNQFQSFTPGDLKRGIIFQPHSLEFMEKNMEKNTALFIPHLDKILFLDI